MTRFSDIAILNIHHRTIVEPSAFVALKNTNFKFYLTFDSKDRITDAAYDGPIDPWMNVLCHILPGKILNEALHLDWAHLEELFKDDQFFWDLRTEHNENIFFTPFELLRAALDTFRGRDYLYHDASPLICRCFGIRESDVLEHLKTEKNPSLETLSGKTKAGMGCRSCVPQLNLMFAIHSPQNKNRYYKERAVADWMLEIDSALGNFNEGKGWYLELVSFKGSQVLISFDKQVTQKEEEQMAQSLQLFLEGAVDSDLGFFLIFTRDLQRLKST